jgi:multidrug efflux pump subunit AcrA (membrane-fusion protein)
MKSRRAITWSVAAVVLFAVVGVVAAVRRTSTVSVGDEIPITGVKRGNLEMKVHANGELRASQSKILTAPPVGGGALQITHLLHTGATVKKGDLVMEFDPSEQRYKLDQNRSELLQAEQEITKAKADAAVVAAKDKVELLKARFDVRRAELEVQKNELVSSIDAHKNDLALEQAKRVLAELEQDIQSRSASGQATIALSQEKRNKAKLAMDQAQGNIDHMKVTAPMDGLVALSKNEGAMGGFCCFPGMSIPEYREGDQVEAGRSVGQVVDPKEMEVVAKVGEFERNTIKQGQPVEIALDALPGTILHGTVKIAGGNSAHMFWDDDTSTKFEVTIALSSSGSEARLRPGMTAQITILGDAQKNILYVPRQALFLKDNKRIAYVKNGNSFDPREVKIQAENESRAAIEGLSDGTEIALIDPTVPRKQKSSGASQTGGGGTP